MKTNKLIIGKKILCNAINMNISKEIIIKISQKIDKYILEYHSNSNKKDDRY
ncbi:Spo0E family sporulation regulatory protein-aspartic acid phosphatase [Senegalia massiliensis]|uniref:Spo0E family sporulation regulatory protein-aspartic acid phosphatase n=1 Tax=Senegalia massiliensis TaxID=1720316 RepID=UPI0010323CAB|nr:Spo0E family sporulation regulatory protein-aspartic acid phosphatase [Senegalia massiliensis]